MNKRTYLIGNPAANHRRKEDGSWKKYGYGDQIELTEEAAARLSHLRLKALTAGETITRESPVDNTPDDEKTEGNAPIDDGETPDDSISEEEIRGLIEEVENSRVDDGSFDRVRDKVVALELFDDLPETKKGVKEALELLLD